MEAKQVEAASAVYADLTPEGVLARAGELIPKLYAEQESTDERGRYSADTEAALRDAGVFALLRDGDVSPLFRLRLITLLSRGCPSTAWAIASSAATLSAATRLFPDALATQVTSEPTVCGGGSHAGSAQATKGGWRIQGTWELCDSASYANWFLARVAHGDEGQIATVLVPEENFEVHGDSRDLLGLRGSGTATVSVDAVVSEEQLIHEDFQTPGHQALTVGLIAAVAIGAGQGALEWYDEMVRVRKTFFPPQVLRAQDINYQRYYGRAVTMIAAAEAMVRTTALGELVDLDRDELRVVMAYQQAFIQSWEAVRLMFTTGGSSAAANSSVMGRYFRDLSTLRGRSDLAYDADARDFSRDHFNLTEGSTR